MYAIERDFSDRRTGKNRRRLFSLHRFHYKGSERRVQLDRRSRLERRVGYVRINKWSSVNMQDLKIAKYLR
jgi:hypothetical protein